MTADTTFRLCPSCFRAVPAAAGEHYCPNDGTALLSACPECDAPIATPYAHFCSACGHPFALATRSDNPSPRDATRAWQSQSRQGGKRHGRKSPHGT